MEATPVPKDGTGRSRDDHGTVTSTEDFSAKFTQHTMTTGISHGWTLSNFSAENSKINIKMIVLPGEPTITPPSEVVIGAGSGINDLSEIGPGVYDVEISSYDDGTTYEMIIDVVVSLKIAKIATGSDHTVVLTEKGNVYGWGRNSVGQVNPNHLTEDPFVIVPVLVATGIKDIACGGDHTMCVLKNGDVVGWGDNTQKQVNPASATDPYLDTNTVIKSGVKNILCGYNHTMCLLDNGDVIGWGDNGNKQTNPASATDPWITTTTVHKSGVKKISCGYDHTMCICDGTAAENDGDVVGWGSNLYRQVNPASATNPWITTTTVHKTGVKDIFSGEHTMCLLDNDDVVGWGRNTFKQVNPASATDPWITTTTVHKTGVKDISGGSNHTMCVLENGDVVGWGRNAQRQVNPASATDPWITTTTVIKSNVGFLGVGSAALCTMAALSLTGDVVGWGDNTYKQVNPDSATDPWTDPDTVMSNIKN